MNHYVLHIQAVVVVVVLLVLGAAAAGAAVPVAHDVTFVV
jgi:hypothetical protein